MAADRTDDEYRAIARRNLRRFADRPLLHFVDGAPVASVTGQTFENRSPVDSTLLGTVASGDAADVDVAARAAASAFPEWSGRSGKERNTCGKVGSPSSICRRKASKAESSK